MNQIDCFIEQADKNLTMDLEELDGSIDGESDDLNTESTMERYYSRILRQDKSLDRMAILHGSIETLVIKTEYSPKAVFQPEILTKVKKHINSAITIMATALANPSQCTSLLLVKNQYSPNANHDPPNRSRRSPKVSKSLHLRK